MRTRTTSVSLVLIWAAACGGTSDKASPATAPSAATAAGAEAAATSLERPTLRLPDTAAPRRYEVELTLDPSAPTFEGIVSIELELREETSVLWLNAEDLEVSDGALHVGDQEIAVTPEVNEDGFLGLALARPVGPGQATLTLRYTGRAPAHGASGIYRESDRDDWYIYTQFQALDARRAVPCFDEPHYKTPWQLTLHVPAEHTALSNAPAVSEEPGEEGTKTVRFAETRPMPSYLVALAVGPFEIVDLGEFGDSDTPLRIVMPRGHAGEARYAAKATPALLELIEDYFGTGHPYQKLDSIAVPRKGGAMENPGLITYGQYLILSDPGEDTLRRQRWYAWVGAHEMAHLWFGDLVTMAWWDDTWLNEAFASWMATKMAHAWKPGWGFDLEMVDIREEAMSADSKVTARKIRQPIETAHDIHSVFDSITYDKGEAVLRMVETWVGEETFRAGVRAYLEEHAWGNASAEDFFAALGDAAGEEVVAAMETFVEQPGVPAVEIALECDGDGPPALALSQERHLRLGSEAAGEQRWHVPVCVRYGRGDASGRACTLLTESTGTLELSGAKRCPAWVVGNAGSIGYYRVRYPREMIETLFGPAREELEAGELVGLVHDLYAGVHAGDMPAAEALALVPDIVGDAGWPVTRSAVALADLVAYEHVPEELWPDMARFIRKHYGSAARRLGWTPREGESAQAGLARPVLLKLVADRGGAENLAAGAALVVDRWLQDKAAVDGEMAETALVVAARHGERELFDRLLAAARKEDDPDDTRSLLAALGAFRQPELAREALGLLLSDDFVGRDRAEILQTMFDYPDTRAMAWEYLTEHYDEIASRLPRDYERRLIGLGRRFCDADARAEVEAFFADRAENARGGPRRLAQVLEDIDQCIAFRAEHGEGIAEFLKSD